MVVLYRVRCGIIKFLHFALLFFYTLEAQNTKNISLSFYNELYYSYDFDNPTNHEKSNFIYNHKRHNELNSNLLLAKVQLNTDTVRAKIAIMFGNYMQYNLATEPLGVRFINEANIGYKISKTKNIWLDLGVLPSHIGFESAIGKDCWTLTRSLLAENSPYYETGVKLSKTSKNEKFNYSVLLLNGWQRISVPDSIQLPSLGMQFNYKVNSNTVLNYSNFLGTTKPTKYNAIRTYHNFYAIFQLNKSVSNIIGFDFGTDKHNATNYGLWYSTVQIIKFKLNDENFIALRNEYYRDKNYIVISKQPPNDSGFNVIGTSINYDLSINKYLLWRIETKMYQSIHSKIFKNKNSNYSVTTSLISSF